MASPGQHYQRYSWIVLACSLAILIFLTVNVVAGGPLTVLDDKVHAAVQAREMTVQWHLLDRPARYFVGLGTPNVAIPVLALVALLVSGWRRSPRPLLTAATAVALLLLIVVPVKALVGRPPLGDAMFAFIPVGMGAFPSGHTASACVCYGVAALLIVGDIPVVLRGLFLAVPVVVCMLVSGALIWCGYHWVTDIAGGWALSGFVISLAFKLTGNRGRSKASDSPGWPVLQSGFS